MVSVDDSVLNYYRNHRFNPVLISVEQPAVWKDHFAKRAHLYERHLGLPISFLRDHRVLEFGPNSGENALVLGLFGALLTLVEPNEQVHPRLRELFGRFHLSQQLEDLAHTGIEDFAGDGLYDLVIAEGFLYTLPNRDDLLRRIARHVRPGGFGVISVNDRYGGVVEMLRQAVLYRACRLAGIRDPQSDECLEMARNLYEDDFKRLRASRTFHAWWKDMLVNPFFTTEYLWSVPEVLPILASEGCEFHSSSPMWATFEHGNWYKNVPDTALRTVAILNDWKSNLPFFLTGMRDVAGRRSQASDEVVHSVRQFVADLSAMSLSTETAATAPLYPGEIDVYLQSDVNPSVRRVNDQMRSVVTALRKASNAEQLLKVYHEACDLRNVWGVPYQYICFQRPHSLASA